jgi:hypothetical protein
MAGYAGRDGEFTMTTAYHGDAELKAKHIRSLLAHKRADSILQGTYGEFHGNGKAWKGCAVACSLRSMLKARGEFDRKRESYGDHEELAKLMGAPLELFHLQDRIFEGMAPELAREWPLRFAHAIRPGADLSLVWPRFAVIILSDPERGVQRHASERGKSAIAAVCALFERRIAGLEPSSEEWAAAASAAWAASEASAEARAARAAWAAWAASEASAAAWAAASEASAEARAARAAWAASEASAAAWAAAEASADAAHYSWMSDVLVGLLEAA